MITSTETHAREVGGDFTESSDALPPSDIPTPPSPISPAGSQEDTHAIRPFPLLDLMLSPGFAEIKAMDYEFGKYTDHELVKMTLTRCTRI